MSYKNLIVWQKAMQLTVEIYALTKNLPKEESYGLISQMRRCAVSIPSNIAEGSKRNGDDIKRFLRIAYGSGAELETQVELSKRLNYIETEKKQADNLLEEVMRMLNVMINK